MSNLAIGLDVVPWRAMTVVNEQSLEYLYLTLSDDLVFTLAIGLVPC